MARKAIAYACFCSLILVVGCSSSSPPPAPDIVDSEAPGDPVPPALAEPPSSEDDEPLATPPAIPDDPVTSETAPTEPALPDVPETTTSPPPPADAVTVVDPGGEVEVGATLPGLTRIGTRKCKMCHKIQFASWAETAHALRTPPLECENCHGPGSEYKSKAVMENPQRARAAGLVIPDASFCSQCHTTGWTADMMKQTHDHKVEGS